MCVQSTAVKRWVSGRRALFGVCFFPDHPIPWNMWELSFSETSVSTELGQISPQKAGWKEGVGSVCREPCAVGCYWLCGISSLLSHNKVAQESILDPPHVSKGGRLRSSPRDPGLLLCTGSSVSRCVSSAVNCCGRMSSVHTAGQAAREADSTSFLLLSSAHGCWR